MEQLRNMNVAIIITAFRKQLHFSSQKCLVLHATVVKMPNICFLKLKYIYNYFLYIYIKYKNVEVMNALHLCTLYSVFISNNKNF